MRRRSSGRWIAPLALVIAVVAVYAVVQNGTSGGGGGSSGDSVNTGTSTAAHARRHSAARAPRPRPAAPATYSVQAGDTLEQISVKTGIPLDRLISLNPTIDATALHIGEKIRLHR